MLSNRLSGALQIAGAGMAAACSALRDEISNTFLVPREQVRVSWSDGLFEVSVSTEDGRRRWSATAVQLEEAARDIYEKLRHHFF